LRNPECLVKIDRLLCSAIRQGFYELRNFNDAIVWQLLDSVDEFLLPHNRKHCERCDTATRTRHTFQERGKCFELFPGESLDDAARRQISWFVD
jgi:hypothetical protein